MGKHRERILNDTRGEVSREKGCEYLARTGNFPIPDGRDSEKKRMKRNGNNRRYLFTLARTYLRYLSKLLSFDE